METYNLEKIKKEINKGLTKIFGRNRLLEPNFIVRDIEIFNEKILMQIAPNINHSEFLTEFDDVSRLFVLYNTEDGITEALSKSDYYNKYASQLKVGIEKAFKIAEMKDIFRL